MRQPSTRGKRPTTGSSRNRSHRSHIRRRRTDSATGSAATTRQLDSRRSLSQHSLYRRSLDSPAAASGELDASIRYVGVLLVEDVERRQADVGDFLLAKHNRGMREKIVQ